MKRSFSLKFTFKLEIYILNSKISGQTNFLKTFDLIDVKVRTPIDLLI